MSDWWLIGWGLLGALSSFTFAAGGVLHARRAGRRWHESLLASQSCATATVAAYVIAWLWVGPVVALLVAPMLLGLAFTTALLMYQVAEYRAKRAVFARERDQ